MPGLNLFPSLSGKLEGLSPQTIFSRLHKMPQAPIRNEKAGKSITFRPVLRDWPSCIDAARFIFFKIGRAAIIRNFYIVKHERHRMQYQANPVTVTAHRIIETVYLESGQVSLRLAVSKFGKGRVQRIAGVGGQ